MVNIKIKALSLNMAYRGRRFKTDDYHIYKKEVLSLLPKLEVPTGKLEVYYRFGVSNKNTDYDNLIKNLQDILQKAYGFNDNKIYRASIEKVDTKKGEEFISFEIKEYEETSKI